MRSLSAAILVACMAMHTAGAEIVSASDTHFVLRHEATSPLAVEDLWDRLIDPASWWHPDHTYSGDAANLTLEPEVGGLWREDWDSGSVSHGKVLYIETAKSLRMEAPFGPLQGLGAYTIWTITLTESVDGTVVVFDEVSTGPPTADMSETARAVDFVKSEAIGRLTGTDP